MSTKVKVAVRVRPLNKRELELGTDIVIDMKADQTFLKAPKNERKSQRTFAYDHCFWSMDADNPKFSNQEYVFGCLGTDVLENAFKGYNACIFAYGQTGSGKSYTMMGAPGQKGLIPRICDALFEQIGQCDDPSISYKVEVSYMEIYNEKVRDLLSPKGDKHNLKVREHKILGPYVDGLAKLVVHTYSDIDNLMSEGNKSRTVAATSMNAESSRSHAVFSVLMSQTQVDDVTQITGEKVAKISLVDLAGSERVSKTNASGDRLKEGSNINKSLTTLGLVISALADQASGKSKKAFFVPYRDSVLTWLLKDNLGGNSKTVMVATVSPSGDNYEETLSTLRYADRAKRIENHAVINEDPNATLIRELREEVEKLKMQLLKHGITSEQQVLKDALDENERLMQEASLTWEQKERQTEKIHQERHKILQEMGISVQDSGIAVEKGRYYLVNLNADPSLNEMLVYYLKEHTKIGKHDAPELQDIQLNGLGLNAQHCFIDIDNEDDTAYIVPIDGARTCVNGQVITERTQLRHGDRILWGNNHFFRINCPHSAPAPGTESEEKLLDFDFAQNEIMLNEFDSLGEPLQNIIQQLEQQHEKEKQGALDQQKELYEQKLEELRREKTPDSFGGRNSSGYNSEDRMLNNGTPTSFDSQLLYEESLRRLREEVIRANVLVREANQLSSEIRKDTEFAVTLQIPTATLSQSVNQGPLTSEVAVVVKQKARGTQVWSVDKLSNKIYDMRDAYQTITENPMGELPDDDGLFFEVECHTLIGVATVWLECLYQNVPLDYSAPVISQQGEVCGRLSVEIKRIQDETTSLSLDGDSVSDDEDNEGLAMGSSVQVQITIKEAHGLPLSLCNYVFCQYTFFDQELAVIPPLNTATSPVTATKSNSMTFVSTKVFTVEVDEEFLDYVTDGSLAIEVYGNRSRGFDAKPSTFTLPELDNGKSLVDSELLERIDAYKTRLREGCVDDDVIMTSFLRWKELSRQLECWVEIHELNEQGFYSPVELLQREGQEAGGVFMLRQGYSRRIVVQCVVPKHNSQGSQGLLPVVIESITNVAVGSVTVRNKTQKGLDSYQERDLQTLRDRFSNSVMKKREYLDQQIQEMINKPNKTQEDKEHEGMLIDQWVSLTEERNAILCPNTGSGVPGAASDWNPLPGMETHIPVIFLDLDDNALSGCGDIGAEPAGHHSFLSFEQSDSIIGLPILKYDQKRVTATTSWDSSIHDSVYLNRVTQNTERVYVILKMTLRLSSPALVNCVLRKRICVRMYKRPSLKDSLRKKFWRQTNVPTRCGVRFELISHIPRQSGEQTEERESLAQKAAEAMHVGGDGEELMDGDAIEKYNKGISHVENILNLHKLRQEVLVKEKLAAVGRSSKSLTSRNMRKFASTPNLFNAPSMSNLWRSQVSTFGSNSDLNSSELAPPPSNGDLISGRQGRNPNRASSAHDFIRNKHTKSRIQKNNENRYSFAGFSTNSPSESPRMMLKQVDIDIDGNNCGTTAEGDTNNDASDRAATSSRNATAAANLQTLAEQSPSDLKINDPLTGVKFYVGTDIEKSESSPNNDSSRIESGEPSGITIKITESSNTNVEEHEKLSETTSAPLPEKSPTEDTTIPTSNKEENPDIAAKEKPNESSLTDATEETTVDTTVISEEKSEKDNPVEGNDTLEAKPSLKVGDVVKITESLEGQVRFYGRTQFADGIWVGIALTVAEGKNDGSVQGVSYFKCEPMHGLFIRSDKLSKS